MAVDGQLNTSFVTDINDTQLAFSIDFGELVTISQVVYYNRIDCCGEQVNGVSFRFGGAGVYTDQWAQRWMLNPLLMTFGAGSTGGVISIPISPPQTGRILAVLSTVQPSVASALHIAELQVYGTPAGKELGT